MRGLVARIVVAAQLAAAVAHADPTPAQEATALAHLDRGVAAYRVGDYALAQRELRAAHELVPDRANPHRWLALTEVQLGNCPEALVHVEGFVSRVPADDPRAREVLAVRDRCARTGTLVIDSTPTGATIRLDRGPLVGATPYRALGMRAGSHVIRAEKPGYETATRSVIVPAGGELEVHLALSVERTPIVRRWWFWTAVGTVALLAGATYAATRDPDVAVLQPIQCDLTGCRTP